MLKHSPRIRTVTSPKTVTKYFLSKETLGKEVTVQQELKEAGFNYRPEVISLDKNKLTITYRRINSQPIRKHRVNTVLEVFGMVLSELHSIHPKSMVSTCITEMYKGHIADFEKNMTVIDRKIEYTENESLLQSLPQDTRSLVHGDLNGTNILVHDSEIFLIDFEHSHCGNILYDISEFFTVNCKSKGHFQSFMSNYTYREVVSELKWEQFKVLVEMHLIRFINHCISIDYSKGVEYHLQLLQDVEARKSTFSIF